MSGVMPMISVPSVDEVREFYVETLGFAHQMAVVGKDGHLDFCNLTRGETSLMFSRPSPDQQVPDQEAAEPAGGRPAVELYVHVDDVDDYHRTLTARGVRVAEPLTDQWWGDRTFVITDPNGYRLWFVTKVAEPVPPPGMKIV